MSTLPGMTPPREPGRRPAVGRENVNIELGQGVQVGSGNTQVNQHEVMKQLGRAHGNAQQALLNAGIQNVYFAAPRNTPTFSVGQRVAVALSSAVSAMALIAMLWQWTDTTRGGGVAVLMIAACLLLFAMAIIPWSAVLGGADRPVEPPKPVTARAMLIQKVGRLWIEEALHRSLHQVVKIEISIDGQRDAVSDPWGQARLLHLDDPQPYPDGTRLSAIYGHEGVHRLVVIGAPGSGKTTHLLELTEDLLTEAKGNTAAPVPVVLRLTDWTGREKNLESWIIVELGIRYSVAPAQAAEWTRNGMLILLLDGLDEVAAPRRHACVDSIEKFCRDPHQTIGIIISCRTADYEQLGRRLHLDDGVRIRPLSTSQVGAVLDYVGSEVVALKAAFARHADMRELLTTPLMLGVAILATSGLEPGSPIPADRIYPLYVRRMLDRRRALRSTIQIERPFSNEQTHRYLVWLAILMNVRGTTSFYTDWITPAWLPGIDSPVRVPDRNGPVAWLGRRWGWDHTSTALIGAAYAALLVVAAGAPLGIQVGGPLAAAIIVGCSVVVASVGVGTSFGILFRKKRPARYLRILLGPDESSPYSASTWMWSWRKAAHNSLVVTIPGLVVAAIGTPLTSLTEGVMVLAVVMLGGALSGGNVPDNREPPASPGQALSASLRRLTVLTGLLAAIAFTAAVIIAVFGGPWATLIAALPFTSALMLLFGPGRAWLRNRAATFGLRHAGLLPRRLPELLMYADERVLMRRAGGGFSFLHRTLQDYLASQDPAAPMP